jgi:hypothetical protein
MANYKLKHILFLGSVYQIRFLFVGYLFGLKESLFAINV